jgi:hypothetical protein
VKYYVLLNANLIFTREKYHFSFLYESSETDVTSLVIDVAFSYLAFSQVLLLAGFIYKQYKERIFETINFMAHGIVQGNSIS